VEVLALGESIVKKMAYEKRLVVINLACSRDDSKAFTYVVMSL
jgi:hypothetical protein